MAIEVKAEFSEIAAHLECAGSALLKLSGNVAGSWGAERRIPGSIYRESARKALDEARAALDTLGAIERAGEWADGTPLPFPWCRVARSEASVTGRETV